MTSANTTTQCSIVKNKNPVRVSGTKHVRTRNSSRFQGAFGSSSNEFLYETQPSKEMMTSLLLHWQRNTGSKIRSQRWIISLWKASRRYGKKSWQMLSIVGAPPQEDAGS